MEAGLENTILVGVDIGGTFTDAVFLEGGCLTAWKTPTTPEDPSRGVLALAQKVAGKRFTLTHGSTLATNAVLERKGARTAFFATRGFSDLVAIGRQNRPRLYSLEIPPREPLVREELCFDIPERVDFMGDVLRFPDAAAIKECLGDAAEKGAVSLAVCFLFSFKNPVNEEKVKECARGLFHFVSISSEVLPEYREYERASTTLLNAYVSPILDRYVCRLENDLGEMGAVDFKIMESGGGILPAKEAGKSGVRTILSGPAGGVAGAFFVAGSAGVHRIITLDMGGTSTDVSLCNGSVGHTREGSIEGFPIRVPMVDIITVGAGGGSIARIDPGGVLKVGPDSAGASPGPAAYGKGGMPTVTDAHLVLGTIGAGDFLGGDFPVDRQLSIDAIAPLADEMGVSLEEAAAGIVNVALSHMERALRVVSLERGHDPRRFTLVPFGGAGPVHAPGLAERLGMEKILVPRYPGVLSALGMLVCPFRVDFGRTVMKEAEGLTPGEYEKMAAGLYEKAGEFFKRNRFQKASVDYAFDLRYRGQSFELPVLFDTRDCTAAGGEMKLPPIPCPDMPSIVEEFHRIHESRYGFCRREEPVEAVNVRINVRGETPAPPFAKRELAGEDPAAAFIGCRRVLLPSGTAVEAGAYVREKLAPGNRIAAPAVIVQYDTVILVPPGWNVRVDEFENILMEKCHVPVH